MARKKTVTEPQEEPMQDADIPAEDMADGDANPVPMEESPEGTVPDSGEPGVESIDFPAVDEPPFGDAVPEGDAVPDSSAFVEPSDMGGDFPDGGGNAAFSGTNDDPAMEDGDYADFLHAVSEGGGMDPISPSEAAPLLLADTGAEDGFGDDLPSVPEGGAPNNDGATEKSTDHAKVEARRISPRRERERVLTIDPHAEVLTPADLEDIIWHEIQNANRTKHILTGKLDSVGRTQNGMDTAVILYKGVRVLIPLKEMGVHTGQVPSGPEYPLWVDQVTRILHARMDSDVDFVVRGIDEDSRTVVGSRRDAMRRKRKRFYMDTDEQGRHLIEEGRVVQARVVAVADKLIRVEVFGVECNVRAKSSSWMWVGNARDQHFVGELILVRVRRIQRSNVDRITIQVDADGAFGEDGDNLSQCQPQCRYVGQITDVRKGVVFVRLNIGANAVAHTCLDMRMPGKKDTVSFTVTRLDEKRGLALGIITRIIKQNL